MLLFGHLFFCYSSLILFYMRLIYLKLSSLSILSGLVFRLGGDGIVFGAFL